MRDAVLQIHGPIGYQERHPALEKAIVDAAADGVTWFGPTSKSQLTDVYRGVDCLVYASAGGGMITASKTYEYRATGKPIVVVSEATPDALRVLADYPRTHVAADMSREAIADALHSAARDATGDGAALRLADAQAVGARDSRDDVLAAGVEHVLRRLSEQAGTS